MLATEWHNSHSLLKRHRHHSARPRGLCQGVEPPRSTSSPTHLAPGENARRFDDVLHPDWPSPALLFPGGQCNNFFVDARIFHICQPQECRRSVSNQSLLPCRSPESIARLQVRLLLDKPRCPVPVFLTSPTVWDRDLVHVQSPAVPILIPSTGRVAHPPR
jgi:hypothetical protein